MRQPFIRGGWVGQMDENLWKGVYLALCSGLSETSQTLDTVSNLATVDDPGVIFTSISYPVSTNCIFTRRTVTDICMEYVGHIGVGSSVVCSTVSGNAKASESGTDDRQFPRFFLYVRSDY